MSDFGSIKSYFSSQFSGFKKSSDAAKLAVPPATDKPASPSTRLSWKERASRCTYGMLGFHAVYHLLDNGLANFFALDILRHGTNILSYLSINLRGADPKMGGTMEAEYRPDVGDELRAHTKNRFFVMPSVSHANGEVEKFRAENGPANFIRMATVNLVSGRKEDSILSQLIQVCSPVLRFKFRPEEVTSPRFEPDPKMQPALYTEHSISPGRLGIYGSLTQGINLGMFRRMANHPTQVLTGAAMIGAAAYIGKRTY